MPTDTERLDWLVGFPAGCNQLTDGRWRVWSLTNDQRSGDDYPYGATIREAIDAAMTVEAGEDDEMDRLRKENQRLKRNCWSPKPQWVELLAESLSCWHLHDTRMPYSNAGSAIRAQQAELDRLRTELAEKTAECADAYLLGVAEGREDEREKWENGRFGDESDAD